MNGFRRVTQMRLAFLSLAALVGAGIAVPASAAETEHPPKLSWSWTGPFGTFDRAQIQRGFQVYREVCQACHGLQRIAFRNLAEPGGPEFSKAQVTALAAEYKIQAGPNDAGAGSSPGAAGSGPSTGDKSRSGTSNSTGANDAGSGASPGAAGKGTSAPTR